MSGQAVFSSDKSLTRTCPTDSPDSRELLWICSTPRPDMYDLTYFQRLSPGAPDLSGALNRIPERFPGLV
jgi:hypothetical protein